MSCARSPRTAASWSPTPARACITGPSGTSSTASAVAPALTASRSGAEPHARPSTCVRAAHAAGLISRGCRCRGAVAAALNVPRACRPVLELLVFRGRAAPVGARRRAARADLGAALMTPLAPLLQAFFLERLARQRGASPHTIAAYRDGFRLLLGFLHEQTGKTPSKLAVEDLDAETIGRFLQHLETKRGNSVRTRNARLTAIHSFFQFASLKVPDQAELIARVFDLPEKRFDTTADQLSHRARDRRAARRPGPLHLDRTQRPRAPPARSPGRAARLRTRRPALPRPPALNQPLGQMRRQGPKRKVHAAHPPDRSSAAHLAARARRQPNQPAVPQPQRPTPHPRRNLATSHHPRRHRRRAMPLDHDQKHHPAHAASLRGRLGYVAGWRVSLAGPVAGAGSGHIIRAVIGRSGRAIRGDLGRPSSWAGFRG